MFIEQQNERATFFEIMWNPTLGIFRTPLTHYRHKAPNLVNYSCLKDTPIIRNYIFIIIFLSVFMGNNSLFFRG